MDQYVKSIVPIIEVKYESFTQVEKSIADFFLTNREAVDLSAKSVSEQLFVSMAALSRFAKKCGFQGYREFVYSYKESIAESRFTEVTTSNVRKVLNIYQEIINKAYSLVDEAQMMRIVEYINGAEQVWICGKGSSGLAASEMEERFMRIGVNINSLQEADRIRMCTVFQDKNKLVIGMSLSGESEEILYLLEGAYARGAKTILFTANDKEIFKEFCTEVVLIPSIKYMYGGNIVSPQLPLLAMMDILYYYYVDEDEEKKFMYNNTIQALNDRKKQPHYWIE
ncbi:MULTISPECIES: MurR/RpiR family transcriptional regulator [Suilimivivens]|uniref:MurR/RpiR family transcriptional regulator n=1 Tax=Suilimivivens aceti TaxID=2981774 RepID=A0ABT2T637_9FIRM|nr:MurR/RpiR family transcriptional regulator [Suilimivivens aceti]MCU6745377.1 MurR/RpiR family transcriptional regulator [Suilimivivens aceti]SCI17545.1 MurPQ operon repressor [uncultured Clostridium sp.]